MPTIHVSSETHTELNKIKGELLAKNGRERSFDEVIAELIACWKKEKEKNEG
jgi:predicted CopG family antitoxin